MDFEGGMKDHNLYDNKRRGDHLDQNYTVNNIKIMAKQQVNDMWSMQC